MLGENIKTIRRSKGLSQEELAVKLNVVRQTISKWEHGLSVPDSDLLISLSEALETPVGTLLGESAAPQRSDDLRIISEKLEIINLQLSRRQREKKHIFLALSVLLCVVTVTGLTVLAAFESPYLSWNYENPETAVIGTAFHAFEFIFVRIAPIGFIIGILGIIMSMKK